jgi:hypothetical protein
VGKVTDDDLDVIDGRRQQLVGKIQERYGMAREEAERQAHEFIKSTKTLPDDTNTFEAERARRVGGGSCFDRTGRNALTGISPSLLSLRYRKSPYSDFPRLIQFLADRTSC